MSELTHFLLATNTTGSHYGPFYDLDATNEYLILTKVKVAFQNNNHNTRKNGNFILESSFIMISFQKKKIKRNIFSQREQYFEFPSKKYNVNIGSVSQLSKSNSNNCQRQ